MNIGTWDIKKTFKVKIPNSQTYTELLSCDFQFFLSVHTNSCCSWMHEISCSSHLKMCLSWLLLPELKFCQLLLFIFGCYVVTCLPTVVLTNDNEFTFSTATVWRGSPPFLSLKTLPASHPFFLLQQFLTQTICSIFSTIPTSFSMTSSVEASIPSETCSASSISFLCSCLWRGQGQEGKPVITEDIFFLCPSLIHWSFCRSHSI